MTSFFTRLAQNFFSLFQKCYRSSQQWPFKSNFSHLTISNQNISNFKISYLNICNFKISNLNIYNLVTTDVSSPLSIGKLDLLAIPPGTCARKEGGAWDEARFSIDFQIPRHLTHNKRVWAKAQDIALILGCTSSGLWFGACAVT